MADREELGNIKAVKVSFHLEDGPRPTYAAIVLCNGRLFEDLWLEPEGHEPERCVKAKLYHNCDLFDISSDSPNIVEQPGDSDLKKSESDFRESIQALSNAAPLSLEELVRYFKNHVKAEVVIFEYHNKKIITLHQHGTHLTFKRTLVAESQNYTQHIKLWQAIHRHT